MNNYTANITEEIRIEMGKMLILHEFRKLFRGLGTKFPDIDRIGKNVFVEDEVGIRDFWNLVDALMMGYKLKDIVPNITSACFDWTLENLPVDKLKFSSNITQIEGFDIAGKLSSEVFEYLQSYPDTLTITRENNLKNFPEEDIKSLDPVIVFESDGEYSVKDGNGRLLRAIFKGIKELSAYVGKQNANIISNHWVATSYLMRLKKETQNSNKKIANSARTLLKEITATSQNAQYELEHRA